MAPYRVLFLCTGNSARSIMAEAILRHRGAPRYEALSAGSAPAGAVHPLALATLRRNGIPAEGARSKSWNEFAAPSQQSIDLVVTVCDRAAREPCPVWPKQPVQAHWSIADPAAVEGSQEERGRAFDRAFRELDERIARFTSLQVENLDTASLRRRLEEIGLL